MSEGNRRWSPFAYGNNNPIRFIDPDGMESSAYGGFTSQEEMDAKHAAFAQANIDKDKTKGERRKIKRRKKRRQARR